MRRKRLRAHLIHSKGTVNVILIMNRALCELGRKKVNRVTKWTVLTLFLGDLFPCWTSYPGICICIPHLNLINMYFIRMRHFIQWKLWVFQSEVTKGNSDGELDSHRLSQ